MANRLVQQLRTPSIGKPDSSAATGEGESTLEALLNFQPYLTLLVPATITELILACKGWIDGKDNVAYTMEAQVLHIQNVTLHVESAPDREGPWLDAIAFTATTKTMVVLSSEGGSAKFSRFIRWRAEGDGANPWEICFRLKTMPGTTLDRAVQKPRVA